MTSIGDTLRRERLRRSWNLEKVSTETKISLHLLEAIESDAFERLPGGVFAKSFVRQYARLLGLDEEELAAELSHQYEEPVEPSPAPEPEHSAQHLPTLPSFRDIRERLGPDNSLSALLWLVLVVVACAGVYGLWQKRHPAANQKTVAATAPSRVASRVVAQPASLSKTGATVSTVPPKSDFRPAEISDSGTIKVPAVPAESNHTTQPPTTQPLASPVETVAGPAAVRAEFSVAEPVWVSIKTDGNRAFTGTLEPNGIKQLAASKKITVLVGNAGGLKITLNGKAVGPLGPDGEIRLLVLTPAGAHVVPRTPPTPPPTSEDSPAPEAAAAILP